MWVVGCFCTFPMYVGLKQWVLRARAAGKNQECTRTDLPFKLLTIAALNDLGVKAADTTNAYHGTNKKKYLDNFRTGVRKWCRQESANHLGALWTEKFSSFFPQPLVSVHVQSWLQVMYDQPWYLVQIRGHAIQWTYYYHVLCYEEFMTT